MDARDKEILGLVVSVFEETNTGPAKSMQLLSGLLGGMIGIASKKDRDKLYAEVIEEIRLVAYGSPNEKGKRDETE